MQRRCQRPLTSCQQAQEGGEKASCGMREGTGAIVVWLLSQRRRSYKVNAKIQIVFLATRTTTTTTSWIPNTLLPPHTLLKFPAPFAA